MWQLYDSTAILNWASARVSLSNKASQNKVGSSLDPLIEPADSTACLWGFQSWNLPFKSRYHISSPPSHIVVIFSLAIDNGWDGKGIELMR